MFRRNEEKKAERARVRAEFQKQMSDRQERKEELRTFVKTNWARQIATFGDVHAYPDLIVRIPSFTHSGLLGSTEPPESYPIAGVEAVVDTAGALTSRSTLTRTLVPGAHGWQKSVDTREVWLVITGDEFQWSIKVQPMLSSLARQFAAKVTGAGNKASSAIARSQPQPQPANTVSRMDELRKLAELRDAGIVTEEEFNTEKARILGAGGT